MYEMAAGYCPFRAKKHIEMYEKIVAGEVRYANWLRFASLLFYIQIFCKIFAYINLFLNCISNWPIAKQDIFIHREFSATECSLPNLPSPNCTFVWNSSKLKQIPWIFIRLLWFMFIFNSFPVECSSLRAIKIDVSDPLYTNWFALESWKLMTSTKLYVA